MRMPTQEEQSQFNDLYGKSVRAHYLAGKASLDYLLFEEAHPGVQFARPVLDEQLSMLGAMADVDAWRRREWRVPPTVGAGGEAPSPAEQDAFYDIHGRVAIARYELERLEDAYRSFCAEHEGKVFKVFRPADIERAMAEDVQPLEEVY